MRDHLKKKKLKKVFLMFVTFFLTFVTNPVHVISKSRTLPGPSRYVLARFIRRRVIVYYYSIVVVVVECSCISRIYHIKPTINNKQVAFSRFVSFRARLLSPVWRKKILYYTFRLKYAPPKKWLLMYLINGIHGFRIAGKQVKYYDYYYYYLIRLLSYIKQKIKNFKKLI